MNRISVHVTVTHDVQAGGERHACNTEETITIQVDNADDEPQLISEVQNQVCLLQVVDEDTGGEKFE